MKIALAIAALTFLGIVFGGMLFWFFDGHAGMPVSRGLTQFFKEVF